MYCIAEHVEDGASSMVGGRTEEDIDGREWREGRERGGGGGGGGVRTH